MSITDTKVYTNSRGESFKVGDWLLFDYKICQLTKVRECEWGLSTTVSDGYFSTGSNIDSCYTLTLSRKNIASFIEDRYSKIRKLPGEHALNYPSINGKMIEFACLGYEIATAQTKWEDIPDDVKDQIRKELDEKVFEPVERFYRGIEKKLEAMNKEEVDGVSVLRG